MLQSSGCPKDIMIVDDDSDIREAVSQVLEFEGYTVVSAKDGFDGLDKLKNFTPSLIILDLMMPGMNGVQFKTQLDMDPTFSNIPVVVLSADGNIQEKSLHIGVSEYLKKPVSIENLIDLVERYCH